MQILNSSSGIGLLPNAIDLTATINLDADDIGTVATLDGDVTIQSGEYEVTDYQLSALAAGILSIEIADEDVCAEVEAIQVGTNWTFQITAGPDSGSTEVTITTTLGPIVITVNTTPALTTIEWEGLVDVDTATPGSATIDLFSGTTTTDGVEVESALPVWQLDDSLLGVTLVESTVDPDGALGGEPTVAANAGVVRLTIPYSGNPGEVTINIEVIGLGTITVTFNNDGGV